MDKAPLLRNMTKDSYDICLYTIDLLRKVVLKHENEQVLVEKIKKIQNSLKKKFMLLSIETITQRLLRFVQRTIKQKQITKIFSLDFLIETEKTQKTQTYLEMLQDMELEITNSLDLSKCFNVCLGDKETIMIHGDSELIALFIQQAKHKYFLNVLLIKNKQSNKKVIDALKNTKTPFKQISYSSACCFVSKVDKVLIGCELITQSGGCVSESGGLSIAISAKKNQIPVMVVCATYMICHGHKYSLKENRTQYFSPFSVFNENEDQIEGNTIRVITPMFDYVPPEMITMFLSGEGVYLSTGIEFIEREMDIGQ